jgi:methionine sulfoxide reductase heme-binding subunit
MSVAVERPTRTLAHGVPDPWLKPGILIGAGIPLVSIVLRGTTGTLNANPIAQVENELGLAALIFLIATLACTPARRLWGWTWPVRIRRALGLIAFGYACLHVLTYLLADQLLDPLRIIDDIVERPFITVGVLAFVALVPLAITSTRASIRRLGFHRWQRLHQLTYVAALLAAIHFIWRVKIDVSQPLTYALVVLALLAVRAVLWLRQREAAPRRSVVR